MTESSNSQAVETGVCEKCDAITHGFQIPGMFGSNGTWIGAPSLCSVCQEGQDQAELRRRRREEYLAALAASLIPPRFRDKTFANFKRHDGNEAAAKVAEAWQLTPKGSGILFQGAPGLGKTHLAAAIANRIVGTVPILFHSVPEMLSLLRCQVAGGQDILGLAKRVRVLILDDIGAEKPSEWVHDVQFGIINHRYNHRLPTILTTNCSIEQLEQRVGERISSRIVEMSQCVKLNGEDQRIAQKRAK